VKLLLDTHIWIWSLVAPERLHDHVRDALIAPDTERWLSPVSVWEALLLVERGRIRPEGAARPWVESLLRAVPCREAPLTHEIALASRALALTHEDPADRFLAATAQVHGLTLVTADERLIGAHGYGVLANR
jgi:PIN domain nuclease of toxin-antitoxin system